MKSLKTLIMSIFMLSLTFSQVVASSNDKEVLIQKMIQDHDVQRLVYFSTHIGVAAGLKGKFKLPANAIQTIEAGIKECLHNIEKKYPKYVSLSKAEKEEVMLTIMDKVLVEYEKSSRLIAQEAGANQRVQFFGLHTCMQTAVGGLTGCLVTGGIWASVRVYACMAGAVLVNTTAEVVTDGGFTGAMTTVVEEESAFCTWMKGGDTLSAAAVSACVISFGSAVGACHASDSDGDGQPDIFD